MFGIPQLRYSYIKVSRPKKRRSIRKMDVKLKQMLISRNRFKRMHRL